MDFIKGLFRKLWVWYGETIWNNVMGLYSVNKAKLQLHFPGSLLLYGSGFELTREEILYLEGSSEAVASIIRWSLF